MTTLRLPLGEGLSRGTQVTIRVDGRTAIAFRGESVAAALLANGYAVTRETRRGAPRGVFCGMGVCFDCLVVVNGTPNTRACATWVDDGMVIERQVGFGRNRTFANNQTGNDKYDAGTDED
jgi:predicted molibdopterin-dependent oxidoreductase YjgC